MTEIESKKIRKKTPDVVLKISPQLQNIMVLSKYQYFYTQNECTEEQKTS